MKHILSLILSIFVLFGCSASVFANEWSLCDLSDLGIAPMKASPAEEKILVDGKISEGEYGLAHISDMNTGLCVAPFQDEKISKNAMDRFSNMKPIQKTYVSFDEEYIYCGVKVSFCAQQISSFNKEGLGKVYPFSLSIGLAPGEHPSERCSFLTNTYYFSEENLRCVAVSGERVFRSAEEGSKISLRISNLSEMYRENGYKDRGGILWNADHYSNNASFCMEKDNDRIVASFEFVIPIGDALLSVAPSEREKISSQLAEKKGNLCGSFVSQFCASSEGDCVVFGISAADPCPLSNNGENWKEYIKKNYKAPDGGDFALDFLPIPLYFLGTPPVKNQGDRSKNEALAEEIINEKEFPSRADEPKVSATVTAENGENLENDESIFDDLPDEDDFLPEDTEIRYDKSDADEKTEENKESVFGSVFTFLSGVLLFAATIVLVFFLKNPAEKDKEKENKTKKSKKG